MQLSRGAPRHFRRRVRNADGVLEFGNLAFFIAGKMKNAVY